MIILTRHAIRRMHQRMGLPKRAVLRTAEIALRYGVEIGQEKQMTGWAMANQYSCCGAHRVMHYGEFYFIFRKEVSRDLLITVIPAKALPNLKKGAIYEDYRN
jgi:hypothetical protein